MVSLPDIELGALVGLQCVTEDCFGVAVNFLSVPGLYACVEPLTPFAIRSIESNQRQLFSS